ncbi:MAG: hypothetical protein MJZ03_06885 [archaeon]|nr:hypothetical protein [archaeon]
MKKVIYSRLVEIFLLDSITQLVERGYFSEEEYAVIYIRELITYFSLNLNNLVSYEAPSYFNRYGDHLQYAMFNKSARTTWYAFFEETDTEFHIKYLGNNHLIGQYLNQ